MSNLEHKVVTFSKKKTANTFLTLFLVSYSVRLTFMAALKVFADIHLRGWFAVNKAETKLNLQIEFDKSCAFVTPFCDKIFAH